MAMVEYPKQGMKLGLQITEHYMLTDAIYRTVQAKVSTFIQITELLQAKDPRLMQPKEQCKLKDSYTWRYSSRERRLFWCISWW